MSQHLWNGDWPPPVPPLRAQDAYTQRPVRGPYDALADAEDVLWRCQTPGLWQTWATAGVMVALALVNLGVWAAVIAIVAGGWKPWQ